MRLFSNGFGRSFAIFASISYLRSLTFFEFYLIKNQRFFKDICWLFSKTKTIGNFSRVLPIVFILNISRLILKQSLVFFQIECKECLMKKLLIKVKIVRILFYRVEKHKNYSALYELYAQPSQNSISYFSLLNFTSSALIILIFKA